MSSFDPATVRQAVAEFTPLRPEKFQDLIPAKEVIAELRQKRASYRAIAELLTQHSRQSAIPSSKSKRTSNRLRMDEDSHYER